MNTKSILISIALGFVLTVSVGEAIASGNHLYKTPYNGVISGTVSTSQIDAVNPGDGVKAFLATFGVTTRNFGQITAQGVSEDIAVTVPSGACAAGTDLEFALGNLRFVHRFPNGDLLYLKALTRTVCVDLETLTSTIDESGEFDGGTGQFAQATGTWKITGAVDIFVVDPATQLFGAVRGELKGKIITPTPIRMALKR
jgi:hypothetical protein